MLYVISHIIDVLCNGVPSRCTIDPASVYDQLGLEKPEVVAVSQNVN